MCILLKSPGYRVLCKGRKYQVGQKAQWRTGPGGHLETWEKVAEGKGGWRREGYEGSPWERDPGSVIMYSSDILRSGAKQDVYSASHLLGKFREKPEEHRDAAEDHLSENFQMHPEHVEEFLDDHELHEDVDDLKRELFDKGERQPTVKELLSGKFEPVGRGEFGQVFLDTKKFPQRAHKLMFNATENEASKEHYAAQKAYDAGVGPEVFGFSVDLHDSSNRYILGMEYLDDYKTYNERAEEIEHLDDEEYDKEREDIALSTAKAFEKLHRSGIAHGDAHGRNIMISADNDVKFVDFGSALTDGTFVSTEAIMTGPSYYKAEFENDRALDKDLKEFLAEQTLKYTHAGVVPQKQRAFAENYYDGLRDVFQKHGRDF